MQLDPLALCAPLYGVDPWFSICKLLVIMLMIFMAYESGKLKEKLAATALKRKEANNARNRKRGNPVDRQ